MMSRKRVVLLPLLVLTLTLPACAVTRASKTSVPFSAGYNYQLQPPGMGPNLSVLQRITVYLKDNSREMFLTVLENDGQALKVAILNMMGQTLVVLNFSDGKIKVDPRGPIPAGLKPERVLGLIQVALWPRPVVKSGLAPGLRMVENRNGFDVYDRDKKVMSVESDGTCCPFTETRIIQHLDNLRIKIERVEQ